MKFSFLISFAGDHEDVEVLFVVKLYLISTLLYSGNVLSSLI